MDFIEKIKTNKSQALKVAGFIIAGIVILAFIISLSGSSVNFYDKAVVDGDYASPSSQGMVAYEESMESGAMLSERNVITSPTDDFSSGSDAEDFEVTEYNARIETTNLNKTCSVVSGLKSEDYIIFENSNEYDRGCNYTFKVEKERVQEVLGIIEDLDPKELSENSYTIKQRVDDYTSELEILEQKLESINDTLDSAISAYDDITEIATQAQDAESLAKIIDSKVNIIERLTQERINITSSIERYERSRNLQLDRLNYTYFHINIYENKYIDGENIKDSWKSAVKSFVNDINRIAQDISINLISLILLIIQYAIYALIIIVVAKYGWALVKRIWDK